MQSVVGESMAAQRIAMLLLDGFAVIAILVSCVGIYGVISNRVAERTREIGVRLALGAERQEILRLVLTQGLSIVIAGIVIGAFGTLMTTQFLAHLLFGLSANRPATVAGVCALLFLIAVPACYLPARRATKVDPIGALRCE
jgi:putative ABC transport system permease protein